MYSSAYVWAKVLSHMEERLGAVTVSAWFDDAEVVELNEEHLILYSASDFRREIIRRRCTDYIQDALMEIFNSDGKLLDFGDEERVNYLNKGKAATNPNANIVYIKGDQFTNELIAAIQSGKNIEFRNKYREADLFLIDDVQFIAGKESTQEEFFHTFNKLYEEHKQIVMTSDRKPSDMLTLEDRLKTRFEWGLIADIQPPDYETRMAILKNKAKSLGLQLDDDVCNYIAINVTNNVRQIEGTVKKILAYRDLNNMPLDLPNISRAIDDMFKKEGNAVPTPSLIISQVCKYYSIDEAVLRGTLKNKGTTEARQMAIYLIRKLTNLSLPDIGKEFNRDHSTVLYAIRKVEASLKSGDAAIQDKVRDITANINSCL